MRAWFYTLTQMHSYALLIGCETQLGSLNSFKSIELPEESEVYTSRLSSFLELISHEINEEQLIALRIVAPTSFIVQPVNNNTLLIYQHVVHRKEVVDEFSIVNLA